MADKYKSTLLAQNNDPLEIQKADLDLLKKINEVQALLPDDAPIPPPIGYVYWQLPDKLSPLELWPGSTWENISSLFAGDFFRAEGGNALAFGAGRQDDAILDHTHNYWAATGQFDDNAPGSGYKYASDPRDKTTGGVRETKKDALETRPQNRTIRLWERTA